MADFQSLARQKAKKYGLDPNVFERQIRQESGFNPNAVSPAGAIGIAQIMPATARGWGVNPRDPNAALDAAAKNMARYVHQFGSYKDALVAYNAGPGAVSRGSLPTETQNYIKTILGGSNPGPASARAASVGSEGPTTTNLPGRTFRTTVPTVDQSAFEDARRTALVGQMIARRNPNSFLLRSGLLSTVEPSLSEFMGQRTTTSRVPGKTVTTPGQPAQVTVGGGRGASAAINWAVSKVGAPGSQETGGPNQGPLASFLNKRFGMSGQPWCAMFTSAAVTKGGAPPSARTASVAEVRRKAQIGEGYQRGFVNPAQAQPGDLILFGNAHIGMVKGVSGGQIHYVGGNQSNGVHEAVASSRGATIVRPKYGARRR